MRSESCWFCASLSRVAEATLRILPRKRQDGLRRAVARLLGRAAGGIALDDKQFRALRRSVRAVCELARQPQLAHRGLARDVFLGACGAGAPRRARSRSRAGASPGWAQRRANGRTRRARRSRRCARPPTVCSRPLFWPWNSGSRMNTEISAAQPDITSSVVSARGALGLADALGVVLERAQQRNAQARLVRAAVGRRDRVAIGMDEAVLAGEPGHRPFDRAVLAGLLDLAEERLLDDRLLALDVGGEIILQAAGEMEHRLGRDLAVAAEQRGRAAPADFDAAEQIGLRARHLEDARRIEFGAGAENLAGRA